MGLDNFKRLVSARNPAVIPPPPTRDPRRRPAPSVPIRTSTLQDQFNLDLPGALAELPTWPAEAQRAWTAQTLAIARECGLEFPV
jgi:hypothetical protein